MKIRDTGKFWITYLEKKNRTQKFPSQNQKLMIGDQIHYWTDGYVKNAEIVKSINPLLDAETVRVFPHRRNGSPKCKERSPYP